MSHRLASQLAALRVRMSLERDRTRRLILSVQIAETELLMAHLFANHPQSEPLPQLIARLVTGQVSPDVAGQAIARDPALAAQVAQVVMPQQSGDVGIGSVAGRDVIHIHIGERAA